MSTVIFTTVLTNHEDGIASDSVSDAMAECLYQCRPGLIAALEGVGIDCSPAYEDGIDAWWGIGSVFCYELGLAARLTCGPEDQLVLEILDRERDANGNPI